MQPTHSTYELNYYDERLIAHFALVFGEGFLSPGGAQEVQEIVRGVDIRGTEILDIGCGVGGPAIVLADTLGAKRITSIDVQPAQIERAACRVQELGLSDRIIPTLVVPGVLPFDDNTFDVVFSKEAINEVEDKGFLFREIFRVLKPGGWLLAGDWMKGDGELSPLFDAWVASFNLPLRYERVSVVAQLLAQSGFVQPVLTSRREWYRREAQIELLRTIGPLRAELLKVQKDERLYQLAVAYWMTTLHLLDSGEFEPTHIRARKPLT